MRGAWIEIYFLSNMSLAKLSLPVRGAWIEIMNCTKQIVIGYVAPCEGSVD